MSSGGGSTSVAGGLLLTSAEAAATAVQGASALQGRETAEMAGSADLSHVLTGLQQTGELSSVLHTQPQVLTEELSVVASGGVSTDPESLRFQYPLEEPVLSKKKSLPTVYREQDRFLPINNVSRVMRNAIPRTGKVSKDAKECMQECVSEFISFITSEAADRCSQDKRKTLTGDDILFALATLGFDNYIEPMKLYLQKIREYMKVEKIVPTGKVTQDLTLPLTVATPVDMQTVQSSSTATSQYTSMTYGNTT